MAATTSTAGVTGNLTFITPVRVLDTRGSPFGPIGFTPAGAAITAAPLAAGSTTRFKLAGQTFTGTLVPADISGVLVNVTLVQASATGGYVTVYAGDVSQPLASTLNPSTAIAANFWATAVAAAGGANAGTIQVFTTNQLDLLIDLVGYFSPSAPSTVGNLKFVQPIRVLDTRGAPFGPIGLDSAGQPITAGPLVADTTRGFRLGNTIFTANGNVVTFPADLAGILAHVTTVQGAPSGGYVTLLPGGTTGKPGTSTVNPSTAVAFNSWATGIPTAGTATGQFSLYSTNSTDVLVDIVGFWAPSNPNTVGTLNFVSPTRILDTRVSGGGFTPAGSPITAGELASGSTTRYLLSGKTFGGTAFPADVKGALMNVTLVQASAAGGFVTVFPGDAAAAPNTSTVNPSTAIAASFWGSGVPAGVASNNGTLGVYSVGDPRHVLIDVVAYFR